MTQPHYKVGDLTRTKNVHAEMVHLCGFGKQDHPISVGGSACVCTVYVGGVDVEEVWSAGSLYINKWKDKNRWKKCVMIKKKQDYK